MHYPPADEIFVSFSIHEISGVQNWEDLNNIDCSADYKNDFELAAGFSLTKTSILDLYETQL